MTGVHSDAEIDEDMPPPVLIDCHTHLDGFPDDEVGEILGRAADAGIGAVITAGTTLASSERAVWLAERFPSLFAGVGIHPTDLTGPVDDATYARLAELARSDRVLVVSEIGLDFQETSPDRAVQFQGFRRQIGLAREAGLPIVFHSREAAADTLRVLREERGFEVGGVMHYFQGNDRTAREAMDLGFYISLARPLLRLPELQAVVADLPLDRLVLETDAFPQPFKRRRDRWTEPRHIVEVAAELARLKGIDATEVAERTTANALRLLGKKGAAVTRAIGPI